MNGFVKMLAASAETEADRFASAGSSSARGGHPWLPAAEHRVGRPLSPYAAGIYHQPLSARPARPAGVATD